MIWLSLVGWLWLAFWTANQSICMSFLHIYIYMYVLFNAIAVPFFAENEDGEDFSFIVAAGFAT